MLPRWLSITLLVLLTFALIGESTYLFWLEHQPRENPYDPIITAIARESAADPFLIRALIWRESRFNPMTHGTADERGLMQVTPEVGQMWAKATKTPNFQADQLYDPATNIRVGTWYLYRAIHQWNETDDPVTFALAQYNAGRSNALKWVDSANPQDHLAFLQRITYPGTRKYVEVILAKRDQYRTSLANNRWYRDYAAANPAMTLTP
ncbi:MAG: lytic transglycosylase domain-containing protein [Methylacidiphilales bacterium]|nr:lytic transglycosylase domain-containing protein [Candidatus Methylacidiphilales bacterium]